MSDGGEDEHHRYGDVRRDRGGSRQEQQANLAEQGEKLPGVAEAMAAYRKFAPYVPATAAPSSVPVVYSTGGNAS